MLWPQPHFLARVGLTLCPSVPLLDFVLAALSPGASVHGKGLEAGHEGGSDWGISSGELEIQHVA